MPRQRSPSRDKAYEMYVNSEGKMKLIDIAAELGVKDTQIRKWKSEDKWDDKLKVTLPNKKSNVTKKRGAPKGNKNSVGHAPSVPLQNKNAEKHGFFSKYLPDEALEIMQEIETRSPIDMLWDNIMIQYTAIIRAQRIMYVANKEEMIKELKKTKSERQKYNDPNEEPFETYREEEWEFQFAWDRQATFLQAQSRAMSTLQSMIRQYDELLKTDLATEEQKLRIEKIKADIEKVKGKDDDKPIEIIIKRKGEDK